MPNGPVELLRLHLRCDAAAPSLARQALGNLDGINSVRDDALLVASELVSNAVLHSGCEEYEELEVVAKRTLGGLVIAVTDVGRSDTTPVSSKNKIGGGGIGLRLVEELARGWGIEHVDGVRVWAELAI